MKILIYGMPRSGTTALQLATANALGLAFGGELPTTKLSRHVEDRVDKILSTQATPDEVAAISAGYDHIMITDRQDLINCCISLHFVLHTKKFHFLKGEDSINLSPTEVPLDHVYYWKQSVYNTYTETVKLLPNAQTVDYSSILSDNVTVLGKQLLVAEVKYQPGNINYQTLCTNYKQIEKILND